MIKLATRLLSSAIIGLVVCTSLAASAWAQGVGDFRSKTSGDWNATSTWQYYDGEFWVDNPESPPSSSDGAITIRSGHTVTVTEDVTIDETIIESGGEIAVASGVTLTINSSEGTDLDVSGRITGVGATLNFSGWKLRLNNGVVSIANLVIDDDSDHDIEGTGTFVGCTLDIQSGYLSLSNDLILTGGTIQLANASLSSIDLDGKFLTLNHVRLTNGSSCDIFDDLGSGKLICKGDTRVIQNGSFSAALEVNSDSTTASGTHDFEGAISVLGGATLTVPSSEFLRAKEAITVGSVGGKIDGAGTLYYQNYSPFTNDGIVSVQTIFESFVEGYSYIAGIGTWANVTIASGAYVNMSSNVTIKNFNLTIDGDLNTESHVLTLDGTTPSTLTVNETGSVYGGASTVKTQGTVNVIQNGTFDETLEVLGGTTTIRGIFNNLQIDNTAGVSLSEATTVNGVLNLVGGNLTTASKTLTLALSGVIVETPPFSVLGILYTAHACTTGTNVGFGGVGVEINKGSGASVVPTSVTRVTGTAPPIVGVTAIRRYYDISPTVNSGFNATFVFHYAAGELNGVTESSLHLYKSTDGGTTWTDQGGTVNTSAHTITLTGVDSFSRWTAAGTAVGTNPTVTAISPSSAEAGNTLTVIITGTNFVIGASTVRFSGTGISVNSTTVNSTTQITATITISQSAPAELRDVSVTTASGRGLLAEGFEVKGPPPPTLTQVTPSFALRGSTLDVVLTGTRFTSGSSVTFGGAGITVHTVTLNSSSQITANITIGSSALAGNRDVSVSSATGTASLANSFQVRNPSPTLSGLSPAAGILGQSLAVTLQGTGFAGSAPVVSFGDGITVVSASATDDRTLVAQINIGASAIPGTRNATVTNPAPGGGTATLSAAFTVYPPTVLTALSPTTGARGQVLIVLLTGTNFIAAVTSVSFGNDITVDSVTALSATQLQARISIAPSAATGSRDVSVTNAGSGGGTATLTGGFTVTNPAPGITGVTPSAGGRGVTTSVTLTGAGFIQGVTSVNFGAGISVSTVAVSNAASMTANVLVARDASLGSRDVTVSNAAPGGGSATLAGGFAVQNPTPVVSGVSPGTGAIGQTLTAVVTGAGFLGGISTVDFGSGISVNSTALDTSGTHLSASITIAAGTTAGERGVTVTNPGPGGGSGSLSGGFVVVNPAPTLTSISPAVGGKGQTLSVALVGTNFVNGATSVSFGPGVAVNSVVVNSQTSLTASIMIAVDAVAAARSVVVTNAPPGGGSATLSFAFNVQNAPPTLSSVSPGSGVRNQTLNVTLSGTGFYSGATTVSFGPGITVNSTTVNSSTQMTLGISVAADAAMGPRDAVVTNPAPGGGTATLAGSFTVSYPVPTLTSLSPNSGLRSQTLNVTLAGTGFYTGVTSVTFGAGIAVNSAVINSLTQMTIGITVASDAAMGPRDVAVTNPAPGGGTAILPGSFTVANPVPTIASITPVSAGRGSLLKVAVAGTQFIDGVTSLSFGVDVSVTNFLVKSSTEMQVNIAISPAAAPGTRTVTVTNAAPGGGSASLTNAFTITSGPATSIEGELGVIPDEYVLQEAYPNPFNPSTRVRYGVPENSRIRLIVHNMLGNVVAELASGERSRGMYELQWHADNLPSGVYLVRLTAESTESAKRFIASRKVVLVK